MPEWQHSVLPQRACSLELSSTAMAMGEEAWEWGEGQPMQQLSPTASTTLATLQVYLDGELVGRLDRSNASSRLQISPRRTAAAAGKAAMSCAERPGWAALGCCKYGWGRVTT